MSEAKPTTARKSSSMTADIQAAEGSSGEPVSTYEDALEAGYFGGPADETDHSVAGEIAAAKEAKAKQEAGGD